MIARIGGPIVPAFARNGPVKRGSAHLPTPPRQRIDRAAVRVVPVALLLRVVARAHTPTGVAQALAGGLRVWRPTRWHGRRPLAEPLVAVVHAGNGVLPLGAVALAVYILGSGSIGMADYWLNPRSGVSRAPARSIRAAHRTLNAPATGWPD